MSEFEFLSVEVEPVVIRILRTYRPACKHVRLLAAACTVRARATPWVIQKTIENSRSSGSPSQGIDQNACTSWRSHCLVRVQRTAASSCSPLGLSVITSGARLTLQWTGVLLKLQSASSWLLTKLRSIIHRIPPIGRQVASDTRQTGVRLVTMQTPWCLARFFPCLQLETTKGAHGFCRFRFAAVTVHSRPSEKFELACL